MTSPIREVSSKAEIAANAPIRVAEDRTGSDDIDAPGQMEDHRRDDLEDPRRRLQEPDDLPADDPPHRHPVEARERSRLLLDISEVSGGEDLLEEVPVGVEEADRVRSQID